VTVAYQLLIIKDCTVKGMWLKNLSCYTLTKFPEVSVEALEEMLEQHRFVGCGPMDRDSHGFTEVFGQDTLTRKAGDAFWLQIRSETKLLPNAAIKREVAERVEEIREREGRKVGGKEKKRIKEEVIDAMLPTALKVQGVVTATIDPKGGYILVDAASSKKADLVISNILEAIEGIESVRMDFPNSLAGKMADLLLSEDEFVFTPDSALVLKGPGSPASTARFAQTNLCAPEVVAHLERGLRPVALEMTWNDRITFTLTEPFGIRKLNFLDLVKDDLGEPEQEDEIINALLTLQAGEFRALFTDLREWLGDGEEDEGGSGVPVEVAADAE
jgi:recombination associated protein RdgC